MLFRSNHQEVSPYFSSKIEKSSAHMNGVFVSRVIHMCKEHAPPPTRQTQMVETTIIACINEQKRHINTNNDNLIRPHAIQTYDQLSSTCSATTIAEFSTPYANLQTQVTYNFSPSVSYRCGAAYRLCFSIHKQRVGF